MSQTGLPGFVQESRQQSEQASRTAQDFASEATTIPTQLKQILSDVTTQNKPLIEGRSEAFSNMLSAPERAEAKFGDEGSEDFVFNPFQREGVESQFVGNERIPFNTQNTLIGQAIGGGERIIDAATRSFQAKAQAAKGAADLARQSYQDTLNEYVKGQELALARSKAKSTSLYPVNIPGFGKVNLNAGQLLDFYEKNNAGLEVSNNDKKKFGEMRALISDMKGINSGIKNVGILRSGVTSQTGPLAKFFGFLSPDNQPLRTSIDDFRSGILHGRYGGALTDNEIKQSKDWAPSSSSQEFTNKIKLQRQVDEKTNQLTSQMTAIGYTEEQVSEFIESGGIPSGGQGLTSSGFNLLNADEFEEVF